MEEDIEMHKIVTRRIPEDDGWEFSCNSCSYLARYSNINGVKNLEILDSGDHHARHANYHAVIDPSQPSYGESAQFNEGAESDVENWLTPEIRAKLDEITKGLD